MQYVLCVGVCVARLPERRRCVTTSLIVESEHVALGDGIKDALIVGVLLGFIRDEQGETSMLVYDDNNGVTRLATNPLGFARRSTSTHVTISSGSKLRSKE